MSMKPTCHHITKAIFPWVQSLRRKNRSIHPLTHLLKTYYFNSLQVPFSGLFQNIELDKTRTPSLGVWSSGDPFAFLFFFFSILNFIKYIYLLLRLIIKKKPWSKPDRYSFSHFTNKKNHNLERLSVLLDMAEVTRVPFMACTITVCLPSLRFAVEVTGPAVAWLTENAL